MKNQYDKNGNEQGRWVYMSREFGNGPEYGFICTYKDGWEIGYEEFTRTDIKILKKTYHLR